MLPVSATPMLIDYAHRATIKNEGALAETIAAVGARIDIDELQRARQSNDETVAKALVAVREFLGAADESPEDAMKALDLITFKDAEGGTIGSREAVVANKTLIKYTAYQINVVASAALDLVEGGADVVTRQVPMLVVGPPGGEMMGLQMKVFD